MGAPVNAVGAFYPLISSRENIRWLLPINGLLISV